MSVFLQFGRRSRLILYLGSILKWVERVGHLLLGSPFAFTLNPSPSAGKAIRFGFLAPMLGSGIRASGAMPRFMLNSLLIVSASDRL